MKAQKNLGVCQEYSSIYINQTCIWPFPRNWSTYIIRSYRLNRMHQYAMFVLAEVWNYKISDTWKSVIVQLINIWVGSWCGAVSLWGLLGT